MRTRHGTLSEVAGVAAAALGVEPVEGMCGLTMEK